MFVRQIRLSHLTAWSIANRSLTINGGRKLHQLTRKHVLTNHRNRLILLQQQTRGYSLIIRGIQGVLKLRYLLLGSVVGGGYQVSKVSLLKTSDPNRFVFKAAQ
jgi:hypothetical protein